MRPQVPCGRPRRGAASGCCCQGLEDAAGARYVLLCHRWLLQRPRSGDDLVAGQYLCNTRWSKLSRQATAGFCNRACCLVVSRVRSVPNASRPLAWALLLMECKEYRKD